MAKHRHETMGSRHPGVSWEYDDQTAREAATGFDSYDVGGFAWQKDNDTIWILTAFSPITWASFGGVSSLPASSITVPVVGTPTFDDVQDYLNNTGSASIIEGFDITDSGSGQIDVDVGKAMVRTSDSPIAQLIQFDFAGVTDVSLTDNALNWVYTRYNGGSPDVQVTTDLSSINKHTEAIVGKVYRAGSELHIVQSGMQFYDYALRNSFRLWEVFGVQHADGMITTEVGTRNLYITAGVYYVGHNRFTTPQIDTSASDTFRYWYNNGSWQKVVDQTQIDNLQYNNYGTGLATLSNNKYGTHFVFMHEDGDCDVVYGTGDYTLAEALAAGVPGNLPPEVSSVAIFIAKVIVLKSASSFERITNPFDNNMVASGAVSHSSLGDLGVDTHPQYLPISGTRGMTGGLDMGTNAITNVGNVDGRDVSADGSTLDTHVADTSNPHSVTKTQVGLGNVPNLDFSNASNITTGTLPSSVLPPVALTQVFVVANEAAQLALSAEEGDVAVRTDQSKSYMHNGGSSGTMADWTELQTPTDSVLSVNGQTGTVVLTQDDVGDGSTYVQTENNFTDALLSKLNGIEAGAEVNVVTSVNTQTGAVVLDQDDVGDGSTYVRTENNFTDALLSKLNGIEAGAEVNNISDANATTLTSGGNADALHTHSSSGGAADLVTGSSPGETSTTTSSWPGVQKLRVTTPSLSNGTKYLIMWHAQVGCAADEDVGYRVQLNDTTTIEERSVKNDPYATRYFIADGFYISDSLSGVYNIDFDFKRDYGSNSVYARNAHIVVWELTT